MKSWIGVSKKQRQFFLNLYLEQIFFREPLFYGFLLLIVGIVLQKIWNIPLGYLLSFFFIIIGMPFFKKAKLWILLFLLGMIRLTLSVDTASNLIENQDFYRIQIRNDIWPSHQKNMDAWLITPTQKIPIYLNLTRENKNFYTRKTVLFMKGEWKSIQRNSEIYFEKYLLKKGVRYILISDPKSWSLFQKPGWIYQWISAFRYQLYQNVTQGIQSLEYTQFVGALFLGRQITDTHLKKTFLLTNTIHVLAISGFHLGIIYFILEVILGVISFSYYTKIFIKIFFLWSYAFLVGMPISIFRAVIMLSVYLFSKLFKTQTRGFNNLGIAGLIDLLINPLDIYHLGFQYSFGAVFFLLWFQNQSPETSWKNWKYWFYAPLTVWVGTWPLTYYYQSMVSPLGIVANVWVMIWLMPILLVAFFSSFMGFIFVPIALVFNFANLCFVNLFINGIQWIETNFDRWVFMFDHKYPVCGYYYAGVIIAFIIYQIRICRQLPIYFDYD